MSVEKVEWKPTEDELVALGCYFCSASTWPGGSNYHIAKDSRGTTIALRKLPHGEWRPAFSDELMRRYKPRFRVKAI